MALATQDLVKNTFFLLGFTTIDDHNNRSNDKTFNDAEQSNVALLDFSKAFDKVNHHILCLKSGRYSVRGNLLNWMKDYLDRRTLRVIAKGKMPDPAYVSIYIQFWDRYCS